MVDSLMSFDDSLKESNISTLVFDFLTKDRGRESVLLGLMYASNVSKSFQRMVDSLMSFKNTFKDL